MRASSRGDLLTYHDRLGDGGGDTAGTGDGGLNALVAGDGYSTDYDGDGWGNGCLEGRFNGDGG